MKYHSWGKPYKPNSFMESIYKCLRCDIRVLSTTLPSHKEGLIQINDKITVNSSSDCDEVMVQKVLET